MKVAVAITCAALLAGCASQGPPLVAQCHPSKTNARPGPALVGQQYGMQHSELPLNSVQFDSHATAGLVAVQGLYAQRTVTDTVEVSARFVSCLDAPGAIRVRTSFLKENQAPAEPTSAWRTVHLQPRATSQYQEMSTSRGVANYLIEIARD